MNKKKVWMLGMTAMFSLGLAACNGTDEAKPAKGEKTSEEASATQENQSITYLDKKYEIPAKVQKIATASLESMEDAALLGVKPVGALTVGGELPSYLAEDLKGAKSIGEKMQPSYETLLQLEPDVILGSSKFPAEVSEKMNKVATTIPFSHISTDWEDNLRLMGELSGKKDEAEKILSDYKENAAKAKENLSDKLKDKKVVVLRLRAGSLYVYPENIYFNPVLYQDLGLTVPEAVKNAKAQEVISLEKLAEMNPDYVFLQFEKSENPETPKALEELQSNSIWKSTEAVKDGNVFVNSVEPLAQGGTAWSKTAFLQALEENLNK